MSEIREGGVTSQEKETKIKDKLEEFIGALEGIAKGRKPEELGADMIQDLLVDAVHDWLQEAKEQGIDVSDFQERYRKAMGAE